MTKITTPRLTLSSEILYQSPPGTSVQRPQWIQNVQIFSALWGKPFPVHFPWLTPLHLVQARLHRYIVPNAPTSTLVGIAFRWCLSHIRPSHCMPVAIIIFSKISVIVTILVTICGGKHCSDAFSAKSGSRVTTFRSCAR